MSSDSTCWLLLLKIVVLTACTTHATAHLGESPTEIGRRLGKGKAYRSRGGWEQREYPKNGMTTYVVFGNNKSIWELTKRNDSLITDSDILSLLKDASAGGPQMVWHADQKCYLTDDGKIKAERQPRHDDFFSIMDLGAIKALEDVSHFVCLGKTPNEVARQYGPGAASKPREGLEQREYGKGGYTIQVAFKNGHSVWEHFKRESTDVTDGDIQKLLAAAGGGFIWDVKEQSFFRDGKRIKACREPGHIDFFSIQDTDAIAH
jgi:hypothetical protein